MNWDERKKGILIGGGVFLFLFLPTLVMGIYYYRNQNDSMTLDLTMHRKVVASLSASAVKLKLDHLVEVARAFAGNDLVRLAAGKGDWNAAIGTAETLSNDEQYYDYYVDRILLISAKGMVTAAFPKLNGGIGQRDVSISEWESSMLSGALPYYVSNVYKRIADPRINIIEVIAPITDRGTVVGLVGLQVPINAFSDFGKDINLTSSGFAYFVDKKGHIITHPKFSSDGPIVDYSSAPSVQKLLRGEEGVAIAYNQIEQQYKLSAYQLVPVYGWGVVSTESVSDAFASRDDILLHVIYFIAAISVIEFLFAYILFRIL